MPKKEKDTDKKKQQRTAENFGLAGAQTEVVQLYGAAAKEHLVAYSGVDREAGETLKRGLKSIAKSRVSEDPAMAEANIKQQAGFSAEVKTTARENAEKILAGKETRSTRTDDMRKQTTASGQPIGGTNDQLYDVAEIGKDGSYIEGTARQLKYVGNDAKGCCKKLLSPKYDKYRDADAIIEVPKDFFQDVQKELKDRISKVERQLQRAEENGDVDLVKKHQAQLERLEKTKLNLKEGSLTKQEALFARLHPRLSTAQDIAKLSNRAGIAAAKTGAVIGGGMSFIRNSVAVLKGDETPEDAISAVAVDTASAAGVSYATGFVGSAIKGGMQNAESLYLQTLSNTALPTMIATTVLEAGKTLYRFADGQIDGLQCLNELGEKGSGVVASTAGATVGQVLIPIPVVGGLIGAMCGYALSSMYYNTLTSALNEAKLAHEERLQVEAECAKAIAAIREYRLEMELAIRNYFIDHIGAFDSAFTQMQTAFHTGNIDLFVNAANGITEFLGKEVLFRTTEELDVIMDTDEAIKL